MEEEDNIIIISKEGDRFEIDKRITGFCEGLSIYDFSEEIDLSEIASSSFLRTLKDFYEQNDFNQEKLKVLDRIKNNKLEENLISKTNFELMQPFYEEAIKKKSLDQLLDLQKGAELFRATEFLNLVACTTATLVYCPENDLDQKEYQQKWDLQEKTTDQIMEDVRNNPELLQAWQELDKNLRSQYQQKLDDLLRPENQDNQNNGYQGGFGLNNQFGGF